jgi:hypothetical protein
MAGGAGLQGLQGGMTNTTGSGNQLQVPTYLQPLFGNVVAGGNQQNQQTEQRNQPFGQNIYGYNMSRLSSMMDPSATLPQYVNPYTLRQSQSYTQPNYYSNPFANIDFSPLISGISDLFPPSFAAPTPAPAPAAQQTFGQSTPTFDTSGLESQIRSLESQIQALTQARTQPAITTAEKVADLGTGHKEQGVNPGNVASGTVAAPSPATTTETSSTSTTTPINISAARTQLGRGNSLSAQDAANMLGVPVVNSRGETMQPRTAAASAPARTPAPAPARTPAPSPTPAPAPVSSGGVYRDGLFIPNLSSQTTSAPAPTPAPAPAPVSSGGVYRDGLFIPNLSSQAASVAAPAPAPAPVPAPAPAPATSAAVSDGGYDYDPYMKKGGMVKKHKTKIVHKGMTNRLKNMNRG